MKVIKTASGKKKIKISKKEWQSIGKTAGWMKIASPLSLLNNDWDKDEDVKEESKRHSNGKTAEEVQAMLPEGLIAKEIDDVDRIMELSQGTYWCTKERRDLAQYYTPLVAIFNEAGELVGAYEPGLGKIIDKKNKSLCPSGGE